MNVIYLFIGFVIGVLFSIALTYYILHDGKHYVWYDVDEGALKMNKTGIL